jgi:hypothetical protein
VQTPDLTTIGVLVAIASGLGGLILGIWNRVERWREYRAKREAKKPYFDVLPSPFADNKGWRPLEFFFHNPGEHSFVVGKIEVTTPGIELAPPKDPASVRLVTEVSGPSRTNHG